AVVEAGRWPETAIVVRAGAAIASLGVLLSLIAGISRTMFAMARNRDLPRALEVVHARFEVPHRAIIATGVLAAIVTALSQLAGAISFSSFAVLIYYAIAHAAALTLGPSERRGPRLFAALGLVACAAIVLRLAWRLIAARFGA